MLRCIRPFFIKVIQAITRVCGIRCRDLRRAVSRICIRQNIDETRRSYRKDRWLDRGSLNRSIRIFGLGKRIPRQICYGANLDSGGDYRKRTWFPVPFSLGSTPPTVRLLAELRGSPWNSPLRTLRTAYFL